MKIIVGVADMRIGADPADVVVTHGLGSCLGIAAHDPKAGVGGILHVMLPASTSNPEKARVNPFMFVDTGVPAFLQALEAQGASKRRCTVKVAGGAGMNGQSFFEIGRKNYIALKKVFWKLGIFIAAEDVGGNQARTMYLEIGSGQVLLSGNGNQWVLQRNQEVSQACHSTS